MRVGPHATLQAPFKSNDVCSCKTPLGDESQANTFSVRSVIFRSFSIESSLLPAHNSWLMRHKETLLLFLIKKIKIFKTISFYIKYQQGEKKETIAEVTTCLEVGFFKFVFSFFIYTQQCLAFPTPQSCCNIIEGQ